MNKKHYVSKDGLVEIRITTKLKRYPQHNAPMALVLVKPTNETRVRNQWGKITWLLTHEELRALVSAFNECDKTVEYFITEKENKSEAQKAKWELFNKERVKRRVE